ncbi:MAG: hypothetical protein ACK50D_06020 [Burkholderiales bacterium]
MQRLRYIKFMFAAQQILALITLRAANLIGSLSASLLLALPAQK